jgi:hypothetical protein
MEATGEEAVVAYLKALPQRLVGNRGTTTKEVGGLTETC